MPGLPVRVVTAVAAAAVASIGAGTAATPSAAARATAAVASTQELAVLLKPQRVFSSLNARRSRVTLPAARPITGGQTILPVLAHATTRRGARRLRVLLPGRPNGHTGWIAQHGTGSTTTSWHVAIRTSTRTVSVYRRGRLARSFAAVVGKPATPTPNGRFFVEESILMPSGHPGAPYALALSARSNVLQEFAGGPGQIAVHGVQNLGGVPGTAVSHGCVRLANEHIRWMAARIGNGVRVTIST